MVAPLRPLVDAAPLTALDAAVARVRSADDFPAMAGRIQQLMAVLGEEDASVQALVGVILQDYSLTVKLLRLANSFRFNRSSAPVVSPSHAIVMMGADVVRDLATTILVWEHFRRRSPGLRPLLMLSLLSANHARELADNVGTVGKEEAYLLGMLRNLGEVLVACYLPGQYAAVLKDMSDRQCPSSISCRRVLHFEFEELGRAVVREWGMPESVSRTMSDVGGADEMHTVVSFAHRLTTAVYRNGTDPSNQAVKLLMQKYGSLRLTREEVAGMLEAGIEGTRETFELAGVQLNDLQLKQQMIAAIAVPDAAASQLESSAPAAPGTPAGAVERAAGDAGAAGETKPAGDETQVVLNTLIMGVMQQALTAGPFNRAVLLLVSATRRELCGRLGVGTGAEDFATRFRFPLGPTGGPLGVAASRGQEVTLASNWELLPEERKLLRTNNAGALFMVPLVVGGRTIGALYVDTPLSAQVADDAVATVRKVRDAVIQTLARHKAAA